MEQLSDGPKKTGNTGPELLDVQTLTIIQAVRSAGAGTLTLPRERRENRFANLSGLFGVLNQERRRFNWSGASDVTPPTLGGFSGASLREGAGTSAITLTAPDEFSARGPRLSVGVAGSTLQTGGGRQNSVGKETSETASKPRGENGGAEARRSGGA